MTANELFLKHVASCLRQYLGNLRWFCEAVDKGSIPSADNEAIQPHVRELKKFMKVGAKTEDEEVLFRYGLIVPGLVRGIEPPLSVLEPERGGFSDKRIPKAAAQVTRLLEVLRFGRQYFGPLSADCVLALEEITGILKSADVSSERWVQMHSELSEAEVRTLADRAFRALDGKELGDIGTIILPCLANFRRDGLADQTSELLRRNLFWPSSMYRNAPDTVVSGLIERIGRLDGLELNHALLALAWTRSELARRAFLDWRMDPPRWARKLHVPPEQYLCSAGWALDAKGGRRELISRELYRIAPRQDSVGHPVPCRMQASGKCPTCAGPLAWLFDFTNVPDEIFSEDRKNAPQRVLCCLSCACSSPGIFSRYHADGTAEWHPATEGGDATYYGRPPTNNLKLVPEALPAFVTAEPFGIDDATSLGGIPMWLQDSEYPNCPDCSQVMTHLAQFDNGSMTPPEEGIFYSFFCAKCSVAAVTYQQT